MATQAERTASTTAAITRAATGLFAERGFAATSVDQIVAKAGVAKGAFYHHFSSKEAVFRAVLEAMQQALSAEVVAGAIKGGDALDRLKRGCRAFLVACCKPAVRRVVLLDGPAVIGWEAWREIDARYFGALTRQALDDAMREGLLGERPLEPLVQLLIGAVTEAAMVCARSPHPKRSVADLMSGLEALLDGLARR
jgi:AcrR family transcriptional regulator